MASHLVYRLSNRGPNHTLKQVSEPKPTISKHEVLVKIEGISLNYRDIVIANGTYPFPIKENVIPCSDGAGEVIEVGSSVEGLEIGDHVIANFDAMNLYGQQKTWTHGHGGPIDGVLREYAAFPASVLVKIPKEAKMSFTYRRRLYHRPHPRQSRRRNNNHHFVLGFQACPVKEKYGVDHSINYKTHPNWAAEALKIAPTGVDFILENGGSGTIGQSLECITLGGIIAVIGFLVQAKQEDMPDVAGLVLGHGAIVRGITVGSKQLLEELVRFVVARGLEMPVDKTFGFEPEEVEKAYEYLRSGSHVGKVCISLE